MLPWHPLKTLPSAVSDSTDNLFRDPLRAPGPFRFDQDVVDVFPDMIRRSVPGYETVIAMSGLLARRYVQDGSNVYDLGSSLGATTFALRSNLAERDCQLIAVDNSPAMIERCRELLATPRAGPDVQLREADMLRTPLEDASMVTLNYTLQFAPVAERDAFIQRIANALRPGGVLVLSEKVVFPDPALNQLNIDLHHDFKRAHGYSDLEIAGKRDAIENVLVPETLDRHRERLSAAGFRSCDVWFQCFNFASIIALR